MLQEANVIWDVTLLTAQVLWLLLFNTSSPVINSSLLLLCSKTRILMFMLLLGLFLYSSGFLVGKKSLPDHLMAYS